MKRKVINYSWPAQLSDFSKDTVQENFSRGKLKVFYKGETADHRYFSDSFSQELIKSLPYTPVVSYYDEDKDDFVGHATEQQIFGIVDPCIEPTFEKDDNNVEWCVCDVVLYTERPDKVGDLAKKIVGHKQSLELDPSSVKYKINYDEKKHFKNIEFTAGRFIGVSVLGDVQAPAFTGSEFFTYSEQFENKMKVLREYCESKYDQKNIGGSQMNLEEFMKLSWGEISTKVQEAVYLEYQGDAYCVLIDMYENEAIFRFYYYIDGSNKLMKINYTCDENGNVTLNDIKEVRIVYEEVEMETENAYSQVEGVEQTTLSDSFEDDCLKKEEDDKSCLEEEKEKEEEEKSCLKKEEEDDESCLKKEEEDKSKCVVDVASHELDNTINATQVTNAEITEQIEKVSVANETEEEKISGTTSFTESERAELENLKREKKVNILNSYKDYLTEEEFNNFTTSIDSYEVDSLEMELLKKYKAYNEAPQKTIRRAFALSSNNNNNNNSSAKNRLDDFVRKNLSR